MLLWMSEPSYKTRREEAFAMQLQLAEADKTGTIMKVAGDIIIANSDMPGNRENCCAREENNSAERACR